MKITRQKLRKVIREISQNDLTVSDTGDSSKIEVSRQSDGVIELYVSGRDHYAGDVQLSIILDHNEASRLFYWLRDYLE